jgi:hypothetical protein
MKTVGYKVELRIPDFNELKSIFLIPMRIILESKVFLYTNSNVKISDFILDQLLVISMYVHDV